MAVKKLLLFFCSVISYLAVASDSPAHKKSNFDSGYVVAVQQSVEKKSSGCKEIAALKTVLPLKELQHIVVDYLGDEWYLKQELPKNMGHRLAISGDGSSVAYSDDESIKIWKLENNSYELKQTIPAAYISSLAWSYNGIYLAVVGNNELKVYALKNNSYELKQELSLPTHTAIFAGNGQYLAGIALCSVTTWKLEDNQYKPEFRMAVSKPYTVAYSDTGDYLAIGTGDGIIDIRERTVNSKLPYKKKARIEAYNGKIIYSVALSRDGKYLAAATRGKSLKIWQLSNGVYQFMQELKTPAEIVSATCSADGTYIATGSDDGQVRIYARYGNAYKLIQEFAVPVTSESYFTCPEIKVAFSADGSYLITGANGQKLRIYQNQKKELEEAVVEPISEVD